MPSAPCTNDTLLLTCFVLYDPAIEKWEMQCGPLPFADIVQMYQKQNPAIQLQEIASTSVSRTLSPEEDAAVRKSFTEEAKSKGWQWDAEAASWQAP